MPQFQIQPSFLTYSHIDIGYWEHLIGLTKSALKKTLGRTFVTLSSLQTLIVEIVAHLNNRPLTYVRMNLHP